MRKEFIACVIVGFSVILLFFGKTLYVSGYRLLSEYLPGGVSVTYYEDVNFSKTICSRTERAVVRDYDSKPPVRGATNVTFYARWKGFLIVPSDGQYAFYMQSDNGARFMIDGEIVIDDWTPHGWVPGKHGQRMLAKGKHVFCVEHYRRVRTGAIRLSWCGGPIPPNTIVSVPYLLKE